MNRQNGQHQRQQGHDTQQKPNKASGLENSLQFRTRRKGEQLFCRQRACGKQHYVCWRSVVVLSMGDHEEDDRDHERPTKSAMVFCSARKEVKEKSSEPERKT